MVTNNENATVEEIFPEVEQGPQDELPSDVAVAFGQALGALNAKAWDAVVLMCGRALGEATMTLGATDGSLFGRIEALAADHQITPALAEWAHESRLARNLGAHGDQEEADEKKWNDETDAREIVEFCRWFFRYVYVLPAQLALRRERLAAQESDTPEEVGS
ncbi:MAG: DUF4145 domain-containing protein [Chloroflexi bacterium]|nr:DUF4145 domain-containing protein [Chloroflexota bacterium]